MSPRLRERQATSPAQDWAFGQVCNYIAGIGSKAHLLTTQFVHKCQRVTPTRHALAIVSCQQHFKATEVLCSPVAVEQRIEQTAVDDGACRTQALIRHPI